MKTLIDVAIPAIAMFALFAIGLELAPQDFSQVRRRPAVVAVGLLVPILVLPLLALALVAVFRPPPVIQAGLLLIAACPIGGISNTYSYLAGASVALSVTLTALSSLLSVVSVPLLGWSISLAVGQPLGYDVPVPLIVAQLVMMLGLPVSLGMFVRSRWPGRAARWHGPLRRSVFVGLGLLLALVIADQPDLFVHDVRHTVPLAAAFVAPSFAVGWATARVLGSSGADCFTLASEFATRNVAVATAIAVTLAGRIEFAIFGTAYFLTELPMMLAAIAVFRRFGGASR